MTVDPLRVAVDIHCEPDHAFRTWTERFSTLWPRSHSVSGEPDAVVLEPRLGGRIFERTSDGREIDWGEITVWDPPARLGYRWHLRRSADEATDVDVSFRPLGDGRTRLQITHTGWEALGADADHWRDANHRGWGGVLPHFVRACDPTAPDPGGPP